MVKSNQMKMIWMTNGTTKKNLKKSFKNICFSKILSYICIYLLTTEKSTTQKIMNTNIINIMSINWRRNSHSNGQVMLISDIDLG
jgi:hypothetical protein